MEKGVNVMYPRQSKLVLGVKLRIYEWDVLKAFGKLGKKSLGTYTSARVPYFAVG